MVMEKIRTKYKHIKDQLLEVPTIWQLFIHRPANTNKTT